MSYFTHLECSVPCGADRYDARVEQHLCPKCGMPLLARYDLNAARDWKKASLAGREASMWRYRELMPLFACEQPISLGEGWTPLVHSRRLGAASINTVFCLADRQLAAGVSVLFEGNFSRTYDTRRFAALSPHRKPASSPVRMNGAQRGQRAVAAASRGGASCCVK